MTTSPSPSPSAAHDDPLSQAYRYLQRVVGIVALALPFVISIGDFLLADQSLRGSISAYYYGATGSWFVGTLCALGVFFLSYEYRELDERRDYRRDRQASNLAALLAVIVALFPTLEQKDGATAGARAVSAIHISAACTLFVLLAYFALCLFTKSSCDRDAPERGFASLLADWRRAWRFDESGLDGISPHKRRRNRIYRISGIVIVACIVVAVAMMATHRGAIFWPESVAVVAFGCSWLVKGEAIARLSRD